jgi:hypothetical protein
LTLVNCSATGAHKDCGHPLLTERIQAEIDLLKTPFFGNRCTLSDGLNESGKLLNIERYLRSIFGSALFSRSRARTGNVRDRDFYQNTLRFSGD